MRDLTNSKLFEYLRDKVFTFKKPYAASAQAWSDWYKDYEKEHPVGFWITETFPRFIERMVQHQEGHWDDLRSYISNRFITKTHKVVTTTLRKGAWHEPEERLLHCAFQLLVDFVEVDKALSQYWSHKKDRKRGWLYEHSRWVRTFSRVRDAQGGIDYLRWEMALTRDSSFGGKDLDPEDDDYAPQARSTHEIMALYHWWTEVRPNRVDSYEAVGYKAFDEEMAVKYPEDDKHTSFLSSNSRFSAADKQRRRELSTAMHNLDGERAEEDDAMFARLVKIRRYLWT